jgi:hypothetical protein
MRRRFGGFISSIIIIGLFANGCVNRTALKESDTRSLQSVSISEHVVKQNEIYIEAYQAPAANAGPLILLIASIAEDYSESKHKKYGKMIENTMKNSDINIEQVVRSKCTDELKRSNLFGNKIVSHGGDAEFKFSIRTYGFKSSYETVTIKDEHGKDMQDEYGNNILETKAWFIPILIVDATLTKKDGSVIWKDFAEGVNKNSKFELDTYINEPELIKKAFISVSQIAAKELVTKMKVVP